MFQPGKSFVDMEQEIINRVSSSGLITIDLEEYYVPGERVEIDIASQLYEGLILKEKDFREFLKNENWDLYKGKNVAITCSADAIIPTWAYMLLVSKLQPVVNKVIFGGLDDLEAALFHDAINQIDVSKLIDAKVVVKGCSKIPVPLQAYVYLSSRLVPVVGSLMFGEPCSTVPVYKKPKK